MTQVKRPLPNIAERAQTLRRHADQGDEILSKVSEAKTGEDLEALGRYVSQTELGRSLGLSGQDFDPKSFDAVAMVKLMQAVASAKPTAEEVAATESIIETAGALPTSLTAMETDGATLSETLTVKREMKTLFAQEQVLTSNGGAGVMTTEDRAALVDELKGKSGTFEQAKQLVRNFLAGDGVTLGTLLPDLPNIPAFDKSLTFTQQIAAWAQDDVRTIANMPEGVQPRYRERSEQVTRAANALKELPLEQVPAALTRLEQLTSGQGRDFYAQIREAVETALWTPPAS